MSSGLSGVLAFLAVAVVVWWMFGRGGADPAEVEEAVRGGAPVLDVRTAGEFASGHVKGAVNIPVDELGVRVGELGAPGKLVVYCASGMRSARATRILAAAGFEVLDAKRLASFSADLRS